MEGLHDFGNDDDEEEKDEHDVMKERQYGTRTSVRKRTQPTLLGFQINSHESVPNTASGHKQPRVVTTDVTTRGPK